MEEVWSLEKEVNTYVLISVFLSTLTITRLSLPRSMEGGDNDDDNEGYGEQRKAEDESHGTYCKYSTDQW